MTGEFPTSLECQLCQAVAEGLIRSRVYGGNLWVCSTCYQLIDRKRRSPYSQVMEKAALVATGYHANRKDGRSK